MFKIIAFFIITLLVLVYVAGVRVGSLLAYGKLAHRSFHSKGGFFPSFVGYLLEGRFEIRLYIQVLL